MGMRVCEVWGLIGGIWTWLLGLCLHGMGLSEEAFESMLPREAVGWVQHGLTVLGDEGSRDDGEDEEREDLMRRDLKRW